MIIKENGPLKHVEIFALSQKEKMRHVVSVDRWDNGFGFFVLSGIKNKQKGPADAYCTKNDAVAIAKWILAEAEKMK